jgi:ATP-dependent DNA ligase
MAEDCGSTRGRNLVIAGYTPSSKDFDALVIVYYQDGKLMYAARTRNGFAPASRAELFKKLKPLEIEQCPFANLPEKKSGRWGAGLTAEKMKECRWLLCRIRHRNHNVEYRTMPHQVLPLLSFLRSASFLFGIIRLRIRYPVCSRQ